MTEIPKEARAKAHTLMALWPHVAPESVVDNVARFIADVSETVSEALAPGGLQGASYKRLQSLILPDPEDDLRQEAREICARDAEELRLSEMAVGYRSGALDNNREVRCTLAALRKGRE